MSFENEEAILQKLSHIEEMLEEQNRRQQLEHKIEEIICKSSQNSFFREIQPFKKGIISFLIDNGKLDLVDNPSDLSLCVGKLFKIFDGRYRHDLRDYFYVQSHLRTTDNRITERIIRAYNYYEEKLAYSIKMRSGLLDEEDDDIVYEAIYSTLTNIENEEDLKKFPENEAEALRELLRIRSNCDNNLIQVLDKRESYKKTL